VPYDPFSQGEQVYLGNMNIELSFIKSNYRTDMQFDSDELAAFFIKVCAFCNILMKVFSESNFCLRAKTCYGLSIISNESGGETNRVR
jgi:hypothetical protein